MRNLQTLAGRHQLWRIEREPHSNTAAASKQDIAAAEGCGVQAVKTLTLIAETQIGGNGSGSGQSAFWMGLLQLEELDLCYLAAIRPQDPSSCLFSPRGCRIDHISSMSSAWRPRVLHRTLPIPRFQLQLPYSI